jgi:hypothetical protein
MRLGNPSRVVFKTNLGTLRLLESRYQAARDRKSNSNAKVNKSKVTAVLQLKLEESDWWRYELRWDPSSIAPPSGKDTEICTCKAFSSVYNLMNIKMGPEFHLNRALGSVYYL